MTIPITAGSAPVTSPMTALTTAPAGAGSGQNALGKDAFLKLLVAQLKYQDPSSPVDSGQFMAQTAQFTQVEKLDELAKNSATSLALQQGFSASTLIGRSVSWLDADGAAHQGVVTGAAFGGGAGTEPTLSVGTQSVAMSRVTAVRSTG